VLLLFLFDHLVGAGEQRRWHVETERLRGFQIDYQLELGWLQDRQVAGFAPFRIQSDLPDA
jgi:hypothetical protein